MRPSEKKEQCIQKEATSKNLIRCGGSGWRKNKNRSLFKEWKTYKQSPRTTKIVKLTGKEYTRYIWYNKFSNFNNVNHVKQKKWLRDSIYELNYEITRRVIGGWKRGEGLRSNANFIILETGEARGIREPLWPFGLYLSLY